MRILFGSTGWPCGLHEIASQIKRLGFGEVIVHRLDEEFYRRLAEFRPQLVGLRIEGGQFEAVCEQIQRIRKLRDTTIILGGPTATSHPAEVLEKTGADYVFAGDAERSVTVFLEYARKPNSFRYAPDIPGLAYHWAGRVVVNLPQGDALEEILGQKTVPYVDEQTLRENRLDWSLLEGFTEPLDSLYLTGGRGCPGGCTFCARLHGRNVRTKTARQILEEVQGADDLVQKGKLRLTRWRLYESADDPGLRPLSVAWCSIFDEDFFLDRRRAVEFLQRYEFLGFHRRYRLSFQTNPCSLLDSQGKPDKELFYWIGRVKAMIQVGAESFHSGMLRRWNKRHRPEQLATVLDALEKTGQDYNVFHILTDYHSTVEEVREAATLLLNAAKNHPRMRIASTAFMIPLFDTDLRRELDFLGRLKIEHFTDYETPQPEIMDPAVVELADRIDEALQDALYPKRREAALRHVEALLE